MRTKKFSNTLIEARVRVGFSPEEMAFVLSKTEQMYKLYERGDFDKAEETRQKEDIDIKIATLDIEIEKKILILKTALWKFQMSTYFLTIRGSAIKKKQEAEKKAHPKVQSNGTHTHTPAQKSKRNKIKIT